MPYALSIPANLGVSQAGQLAQLTAQLVDPAGANVGAPIIAGFVEHGLGHYSLNHTSVPDGFRGDCRFFIAGAYAGFTTLNPQETENSDTKTSSRVPFGGSAAYQGPVSISGDVAIVRGKDYTSADDRALEWTTANAADWPDLTGATITLVARTSDGRSKLTKAGSVITATGDAKKIRVELAAADTAGLVLRDHAFDVDATLTSARSVSLVRGTMHVLDDYR